MQLSIITPEKTIFEGEVTRATFPGSTGTFQILRNHAPLVSTLEKGEILYTADHQQHKVEIQEGVVEVNKNVISVLAT